MYLDLLQITLTVWDQNAVNFGDDRQYSVVAVKRAKIDAYEGIKKLTTNVTSIIFFDYTGPGHEKYVYNYLYNCMYSLFNSTYFIMLIAGW